MRVLIPVPPAHSAVGWLSATGAIGHTAGLMADLDKYEERSQKAADSLRTLLKSEIDKWTPIIRKTGVYAD